MLDRERKESPREVAERLIAETRGGMLGRVYFERGWPVIVLARWRWVGKGTVRNVLIRRGDGSKVVRPFRGLRREPPQT
jgi:acetyl esterase